MDCRRSGIERREFNYDAYFPERRMTEERRTGRDRRADTDNGEADFKRRKSDK